MKSKQSKRAPRPTESATSPRGAMSEMGRVWERLEAAAGRVAPDVTSLLQRGAREKSIADVEGALGVRFPDDYRELLRLHNGQRAAHPSEPSVFGGRWQFLPVAKVYDTWNRKWHEWRWNREKRRGERLDPTGLPTPLQNDRQLKQVAKNMRWIPVIGSFGFTTFFCLDLDPSEDGQFGQVILMDIQFPKRHRLFAPSITAFVADTASLIENGSFKRTSGAAGPTKRYRYFEIVSSDRPA